jgi:hypothetical protein
MDLLAGEDIVVSGTGLNLLSALGTAGTITDDGVLEFDGTQTLNNVIIAVSPSYSANQPGSRQKRVGHSCPTRCFQHGFRTEMPGVGGLRDVAVAGAQAPQITARRVGSSEPDC